MLRYSLLFLLIFFISLLGIATYNMIFIGTVFTDPVWSPNRQYYSQKYRTLTLSSFSAVSPGGSSDNVDGYIKIYDKHGRVLFSKFYTYLEGKELRWHGNQVFVLGGDEDQVWGLPSSAE